MNLITSVFGYIYPPKKDYRYRYVRYLGRGVDSDVCKYFDSDEKRFVAIKRINPEALKRAEYREPEVLKTLSGLHPSFLTFYDCFKSGNRLHIVMEAVNGKELYDIIKAGPLPEIKAKKIFWKLLDILSVAHANQIVHRDLKPAHIYLKGDKIKIIDWGFATFLNKKNTSSCGSPHYAAPEILQDLPFVDQSNDVWSLGIILHAMLCGYLLFDAEEKGDLLEKIQNFDFTIEESISQEACAFLKKIFVPHNKRPRCIDLLQDPWFSDLNVEYKSINGSDVGSGPVNLHP